MQCKKKKCCCSKTQLYPLLSLIQLIKFVVKTLSLVNKTLNSTRWDNCSLNKHQAFIYSVHFSSLYHLNRQNSIKKKSTTDSPEVTSSFLLQASTRLSSTRPFQTTRSLHIFSRKLQSTTRNP